LTDEQYDKLPDSFRKFRQQYIQTQATKEEEKGPNTKPEIDDDFEKEIALQIPIGKRCRLLNGGHRGSVRYGINFNISQLDKCLKWD